MILSRLKIRNFRCFNDTDNVIKFDQLTTFVGANSSGKTASMYALIKMFGLTQAEREIQRSDFHLTAGQMPTMLTTSELYIEAVFEFPELQDPSANKTAIPSFFRYFVVDELGKAPYLRIRLESIFTQNDTPEGEIDTKYYFIVSSESEFVTDLNKKPAQRNVLSNIRCIYVPALRNPSEQLRNVSGTILYRLLSSVRWSPSFLENFQGLVEGINTAIDAVPGVSELQTIIREQWGKYHNDNRYSQTKVSFNSSDISHVLKKAEIKFFPTELPRDYDISELGDGLRSLFYFSLVNSLLALESKVLDEMGKKKVDTKDNDPDGTTGEEPGLHDRFNPILPPVLTILAVEEPENHIAPQLLGKVILNLKEIRMHQNAQVVLSSHTPSIIKRIDARNIRYFRFSGESHCSIVKEIKLPSIEEQAYKYIKEGVEAYPELYFARIVILGEGDSEELVLSRIIEKTHGNMDGLGISVIPLGGRHVNYFWKLLNDLSIPHMTLLDLDKERDGGGWGRIKYVINQLISNGIDINLLLKFGDGIISINNLNGMHKNDITDECSLSFWMERLQKYNVFFSAPLDLDFLLLESYPECYKNSVEEGKGPYIIGKGKIIDLEKMTPLLPEYVLRVEQNTHDVLKEAGGNGNTYSEEQKRLMIWYKYLFLGRSKPATHLAAISTCNFISLPEPLRTIIERAVNA